MSILVKLIFFLFSLLNLQTVLITLLESAFQRFEIVIDWIILNDYPVRLFKIFHIVPYKRGETSPPVIQSISL